MNLLDIPHNIWVSIQDFLSRADNANIVDSSSVIWKQISKDNIWLDHALKFVRCSLVLIGHNLSAYRPRKPSSRLYLALIAGDHSGDLRCEPEKFFASLQGKREYDQNRYEVHFSSGIILNVYDVMNGHEMVKLPLEKIFTNTRK
jgi:hypothetical protein